MTTDKTPDKKKQSWETFTDFDASEYLDSEEAIAIFLADSQEDENPEVHASALQHAAKARARLRKAGSSDQPD